MKMGLQKACVFLQNSGLLRCLGQVPIPCKRWKHLCSTKKKAHYFIFFHLSELKNKHFEVKDL